MMLAVTGSPVGMSTLAPLPTTAVMFVKDSGGIGLMALIVRSSAVMRVRAGMLVLATTTLVPSGLAGKRNGALARLAAARNATTARAVPMMMYSRLRRPRPTGAEVAIFSLNPLKCSFGAANDALNARVSLHQYGLNRGRVDSVITTHCCPGTRTGRYGQGAAGQRACDRRGAVDG